MLIHPIHHFEEVPNTFMDVTILLRMSHKKSNFCCSVVGDNCIETVLLHSGRDEGYAVKYNPLHEGVPKGKARGKSWRQRVLFESISRVESLNWHYIISRIIRPRFTPFFSLTIIWYSAWGVYCVIDHRPLPREATCPLSICPSMTNHSPKRSVISSRCRPSSVYLSFVRKCSMLKK